MWPPAGGGGHPCGRAMLALECLELTPWPWEIPLPTQASEFVLIYILFGTPSKTNYVSCCLWKHISWSEIQSYCDEQSFKLERSLGGPLTQASDYQGGEAMFPETCPGLYELK